MLLGALGFFLLAVVLGVFLLSQVLMQKKMPKGVAITHGLFAAVGIVLLVIYPFFYTPAPLISLVVLILAALGGLTMMYKGITGKSVPGWMALGHGMVAVIGVITLAIFIFA